MTTHPNQDWLDRSNAETLYHLERQGRTSPGVVPFLGAGISTAFGFKDWKHLLLGAAPPRLADRISKLLGANNYEGAAETLLKELGADGFQNMVAASAGDSYLESFEFRTGTVSLLPLLASGPVITTNFDRVLERAFEGSGAPFESVISGPRPDLIVDALLGNRRVLIKLHGDWQDRVGRTFAKSDYDANYGKAQPEQKRVLLAGAEGLLFSSRSLLFIGASLGPDRTVKLLQEVHQRYAGIRHFAIMAVPRKQIAFKEKEKHLRSCGVLPLWYHADTSEKHAPQVEKLISSIVERISVQTIEGPVAQKHKRAPIATVPIQLVVQPMPELNAHFDRVVRLIEDGRLTFFLGAAIHHPTKLMANEFYEELARVFECQALSVERFAVAQYIADRHGRENLYAEIRKLFARTSLVSRETHELFASWKCFRTHAGKNVPFPMVITTNYDDILERRLAAAVFPITSSPIRQTAPAAAFSTIGLRTMGCVSSSGRATFESSQTDLWW
jgi:SIR2-like domain